MRSQPALRRPAMALAQVHLMEWVRAVVATTLGVPPQQDLPPLIMQRETASVWDQIRAHVLACSAACGQGSHTVPWRLAPVCTSGRHRAEFAALCRARELLRTRACA